MLKLKAPPYLLVTAASLDPLFILHTRICQPYEAQFCVFCIVAYYCSLLFPDYESGLWHESSSVFFWVCGRSLLPMEGREETKSGNADGVAGWAIRVDLKCHLDEAIGDRGALLPLLGLASASSPPDSHHYHVSEQQQGTDL